MSRHFSFDFDDPCPGAAIEALLGIRGGRLLEEHAGVAIAILENRPIALRLEGPRAGAYATLTKTGLGRPQTLSDRLFLEMVEAEMGKSSGHATRQVVGLAEGEARLRHVMAEIQEEIQPAISALLALESRGGPETGLDRTSGPVTWSRTECFGALAAFFDMGGYPAPGLCLAEISAQLLEEFHIGTYDLDADEVREAGPFPAYQILATPGLGKTRSVLSLIEALPLEAVVWVFQPTLKKGHEFARDMAGSSRPVHLFRGRGAPFEDGATEHMCRRSEAAANLAAKGYPVKKTLCGATEPGQPASCPHASGCAYLAQLATLKNHQGGGVFVLSHASLTQPPPCPAPHLVVIDEDPSASLTLAVKVGAQALGMASGWATHLPDESEETKLPRQDEESDFRDSSQDDEQPEAVADLFERLLDGLNSPAPLQAVAESITVAEFEAGMKMLRRLERKLATGLTSGLPDHTLSEILRASDLPELKSVQTVISAILDEVGLFVSGVIDRAVFNGLSIEKDDKGQLRSVTAHRLARPAIKPAVPVLVLDGTADSVLMARALRRRVIVSRIDLQRQGEVVYCIGRGFSNASLAPSPGYPAPAVAERDQLWQGLETVLRREVAAAPDGVLVVSTLAVETEARARTCCDDLLGPALAWTHFGATRGINAYTNRQTVILIGRKQPPASAVEAAARSFFALDPQPIEWDEKGYSVRHKTLWEKGGKTSSTVVQVHPDPRANRILWQMREAEVIQAIDRVRAVRFQRRIVILNSLDLRRLDDDPTNPDLGVPGDIHLSWPEFRTGGNRAEAVLAASGGFLPIAPKALARIVPDIFSSIEAAKKWLQRSDLRAALARHAQDLTHLLVRPVGQRGAPWPLIVDRRQHCCLSAARHVFEGLIGTDLAVWEYFDGCAP